MTSYPFLQNSASKATESISSHSHSRKHYYQAVALFSMSRYLEYSSISINFSNSGTFEDLLASIKNRRNPASCVLRFLMLASEVTFRRVRAGKAGYKSPLSFESLECRSRNSEYRFGNSNELFFEVTRIQ